MCQTPRQALSLRRSERSGADNTDKTVIQNPARRAHGVRSTERAASDSAVENSQGRTFEPDDAERLYTKKGKTRNSSEVMETSAE